MACKVISSDFGCQRPSRVMYTRHIRVMYTLYARVARPVQRVSCGVCCANGLCTDAQRVLYATQYTAKVLMLSGFGFGFPLAYTQDSVAVSCAVLRGGIVYGYTGVGFAFRAARARGGAGGGTLIPYIHTHF